MTQVVLAHASVEIKIQPCKTKLFQSDVEYLGYKISKGGVSMILEYIQKIKDWSVLKIGKELAMFLGFAGHYRNLKPQYPVLMSRLNGIKKTEKFLWKEEIEQDCVELKKAFTDGGIQAFPNFGVGDPFILTPDWSKENIGGCSLKYRMDRRGS